MRLERATVHGGFLLTGVATTMLGPILPGISAQWSLNDAQAGQFFAAQFLAALAGSLVSGRMGAWLGWRRAMALGFALMAGGSAGLGAPDRIVALGAVACYGAGIGLVVPSANLLVSAWNPGRRAPALNILNFVWCIGAVAAPPLIALLTAGGAPIGFLAGLAALLAATALILGISPDQTHERSPADDPHDRSAEALVWLTAVMLFLYVGVENSIAGWLPSYAMRARGLSEMYRAAAQATFWGAILVGRLFAPIALRRLSAHRLIVVGLCVSSAAMALLLGAVNLAMLAGGALLAGAGLAAVFPTVLAMFTARAGAVTARATGIVFGAASLGGAAIPWIVGVASTELGGLRAGLAVPLICVLAMIGIEMRIGSRSVYT
ncbi:MAG: MFS transporter [Bryobacteraceae bacterium]